MQKDLENLAKEMRKLSDVRGEFSSDKEFFLYQLSSSLNYGYYHYRQFNRYTLVALAKKLTEKSASKSDFGSKMELVKKGVQAYMDFETPEKDREQFHKIVCQKPETVVKASSKTSLKRGKLQRVHE